ncbi:MAG: bifunctional DNA-formamidopyrimidine glycosylase/DNA-(apurinic or apyrimidinic site) lyase [Candidatus Parcubacteria bacterium]|nr:bifunctional DNA-formamidopyrimidine glycosylase/DNA-(apurinic or apyrimidinic site) lyase [Candidatus Parcubacteria bacterium]
MPELPEVYTIVKYLHKTIKGEILKKAWTDTPKILGGEKSFRNIILRLKGRGIISVTRVGKNILFNFSGDTTLLAHQKMSGHFLVGHWRKTRKGGNTIWIPSGDKMSLQVKNALQNASNRFIHVVIEFKSGKMLALSDMRKFARIEMIESAQIYSKSRLQKLGPDWWDKPLTSQALLIKLKASKKYLKLFLLDQNIAAGLGNIYVDESLFRAGLSPLRIASSLNLKEVQKLVTAIQKTLALAIINKGTSFSDYRQANGEKGSYQNLLQVYGRKGGKCPRCRTKLIGIKIGQRSSVYCPSCQK